MELQSTVANKYAMNITNKSVLKYIEKDKEKNNMTK